MEILGWPSFAIESESRVAPSRELVVAVYKENLSWLKERRFPEKISAYNKIPRFDFNFVEELENIGRESHTYVHHIVKHYDNLADYTTFVQGSPHPHFHEENNNYNVDIFNHKIEPTNDYHPLGIFVITDPFGSPFSTWDCNLFIVWEELFVSDPPHQFFANYGAQFTVSKELIRMRSLTFWKELLLLHEKYGHLPWALEIMWYFIFDPRIKSKF
jgi:hypothetical protein